MTKKKKKKKKNEILSCFNGFRWEKKRKEGEDGDDDGRDYIDGKEDEKTKIDMSIQRNNSKGTGHRETEWVSVFAAVTFDVVDLQ